VRIVNSVYRVFFSARTKLSRQINIVYIVSLLIAGIALWLLVRQCSVDPLIHGFSRLLEISEYSASRSWYLLLLSSDISSFC
jgi:hypothetical protein